MILCIFVNPRALNTVLPHQCLCNTVFIQHVRVDSHLPFLELPCWSWKLIREYETCRAACRELPTRLPTPISGDTTTPSAAGLVHLYLSSRLKFSPTPRWQCWRCWAYATTTRESVVLFLTRCWRAFTCCALECLQHQHESSSNKTLQMLIRHLQR